MDFRQLELELEDIFEDAAESPAVADLHALWQQLEPAFTGLSVQDRLKLSSRVIDHLAELHQAKAHWLLEDWENRYDPQDPAMTGDWLQGLVRQTQQVDLSELTAPVQRRPRKKTSTTKTSEETVVREVPKANLLKMLDQVELEAQKAEALAVAHEENIQVWIAEISRWFAQHPEPIELLQLHQQLGWPLVQLWLSLLLGGFKLEASDHYFYSSHLLVFGDSSEMATIFNQPT
ncbi:hypothetical protein [Nodosilinea nodulosa]|uniref:hypothetical protein n=1 Tax=Nodosilinea nodulosa TaxID=416001 RepID=UPI00038026C4|nr:hypothetical protein [Nodosilinea nodulosa]